jgi:hypothetical protein
MWEPQPLTTLRASMACRGENFTFTLLCFRLFSVPVVVCLDTSQFVRSAISVVCHASSSVSTCLSLMSNTLCTDAILHPRSMVCLDVHSVFIGLKVLCALKLSMPTVWCVRMPLNRGVMSLWARPHQRVTPQYIKHSLIIVFIYFCLFVSPFHLVWHY